MTQEAVIDVVGWVERSDTHHALRSASFSAPQVQIDVVGWVERSDTHHALRSATFKTQVQS